MAASHTVLLDRRLSLVFDLYDDCSLAADIGTDHARLPAALLQRGRCQHMILTDLSPGALENAKSEIIRRKLSERADLRLGDGLLPLKDSEVCGMISVTGMGGRTIRDILLSGKKKLHGASLILSAHTDWHLIRQTVQEIGYHLDREEPCIDAGRYYLVIRARPGAEMMTAREIRLGKALFQSASPLLIPFLSRRKEILSVQLSGILSASFPDQAALSVLRSDIDYLDQYIRYSKTGRQHHDSL